MKFFVPIIFAALAFAQSDGTKPEIRGVVIEPGIEHGVPDVDITIYTLGGPVSGLGRNIERQAGKVITDSQGKFLFQPEKFGDYQVTAGKEGYSGNGTRVNVTLSTEHPSREARFLLGKTGEITGRVLDEETNEPVANYTIEAVGFSYKNGVPRTAGSGTLATTDADGRFTVPDLDPGRYVVVARPRMRGLTRPSETQSETRDYEPSFWPGGHALDSAAPITLISGGSADVGTLRVRKAPLYRVHVAISDTNCPADERVRIVVISFANQFTGTYGAGEAACGEAPLLWNFRPGSYGLVLTQGQEPDQHIAGLRFDVVDKDVDLTASLARAAAVDGRLLAAEGAGKIPFEKLKITLVDITRTGLQYPGQIWIASPDSDGRFRISNDTPFGKFLIWLISPDGIGIYAKETRFNGAVVMGDPITLNADSTSQSLEIVVDDQPAAVTGVVMDGDHSVSKPYVLLTKWPMPADVAFLRPQGADGDEDGNFRLTELVPGDYRAVAVSRSNRDMLDEPGVLQRLLTGTETITLGRGAAQAITLKLTNSFR